MKAFTLIEILIVITIVSVLTAVAIPNYRGYIIKSRATDAMVYFEEFQINMATEFFKNDQFPTTYKGLTSGVLTNESWFRNMTQVRYDRASNTRARLSLRIQLPGYGADKFITYVVKSCGGTIASYCGRGSEIHSGGNDWPWQSYYIPASCSEDVDDTATIWRDAC